MCSFVAQTEDSVVHAISVHDIINGNINLPFTTHSTWRSTQAEDLALRRTQTHLKQRTQPSKKITNAKEVKRYLNLTTLAADGLLVVQKPEPFAPSKEQIVVPQSLLLDLLTALHLKLNHPTQHQLKMVFTRHFFVLDLDNAIESTWPSCHQCTSLGCVPKYLVEQTTSAPPESVGINFATDVLHQACQFILVLCKTVTSSMTAMIINNEHHETLREGLLCLLLSIQPINGPPITIRSYPTSRFQTLVNDDILKCHHITLDIGCHKNINKNPVAECAIQELKGEIICLDPARNPVNQLQLVTTVNRLNSQFQLQGLSSYELWIQREQFTNKQISVSDNQLINVQHHQ